MNKFRGILGALLIVVIIGIVGVKASSNIYDVTTGDNEITTKIAGDIITPTNFNNIVGAIRGIYSAELPNGKHSWGINKSPVAGVVLDIKGALQIGKMTNPTCNSSREGAIYLEGSDKSFQYCDGGSWRRLDGEDCSICNNYKEYTCTNVAGSSNWVTVDTVCDPLTYDNSGGTLYDEDGDNADGHISMVCADGAPDDNYCFLAANIPATCVAIENHYETRCDAGESYWYDDCGVKQDLKKACTLGCTESDTGVNLPDGSTPLVNPMHPQYTTGVACGGAEVGCATGASWSDPYPMDSYSFINYPPNEAPRSPNHKFAGICNEDAACGGAEDISSFAEPTTDLCDAGVDVFMQLTPSGAGVYWKWECTGAGDASNKVTCAAPRLTWEIGPWGACENSVKKHSVTCYDGPGSSATVYSDADCIAAGAGVKPATSAACNNEYVCGSSVEGEWGTLNNLCDPADYDDTGATSYVDTNTICADQVPNNAYCEAPGNTSVAMKVFLEGPYVSATNLMNDGLRSGGDLPLTEPYTALGFTHVGAGGGETTTAGVLAVTGNNAIVDWMFIEIRGISDLNTVLLFISM